MVIIRVVLVVLGIAVFVVLFGGLFWLAVLGDLGNVDESQMDELTNCSICEEEDSDEE